MRARLQAISGLLRESEFPIGQECSVGRKEENTIRLDEPAVSAQHCKIFARDGRYVVSDLGSHTGTFVNGIPVRERELKTGDELGVGTAVFLFYEEKPRSAHDQPELLDGAELSHPERLARNLRALLQISKAIGSLRDEESLPWQFLGVILDLIPADRGAILLTEEESGEVKSQVGWDREEGPDHPVQVSPAIARRVLDEGVPLQENKTRGDGVKRGEEGDQQKGGVGFACVPMMSGGRAIGLIYLESSNPEMTFSQDDLELLGGIAGLGVMGLENARRCRRLGEENQRLRAELYLTHDMVGNSRRMREVYQFIERVAASDSTVLICGESGTGKELAARAIHNNSARKDQPFVALNCAALTETLLESELFGHEKGAFTSAVSQKRGYLEVAEGGTIFLDEIGELSPILQAKLLRVLQEREFVRVGGTRPIKINVRFLAATNKDLPKAVREERFRADLFHRLNVISISLPALRERSEDIPALAEYFSERYAKKCKRSVRGISEEALALLMQYDWPGNIRELENAMERAVVVGTSERILAEDLPETLLESGRSGATGPAKYHEAIRNLKKQLIQSALEQAGGSITEAAKLLGVHANYLHRLMRNLELRTAAKKQTGT